MSIIRGRFSASAGARAAWDMIFRDEVQAMDTHGLKHFIREHERTTDHQWYLACLRELEAREAMAQAAVEEKRKLFK